MKSSQLRSAFLSLGINKVSCVFIKSILAQSSIKTRQNACIYLGKSHEIVIQICSYEQHESVQIIFPNWIRARVLCYFHGCTCSCQKIIIHTQAVEKVCQWNKGKSLIELFAIPERNVITLSCCVSFVEWKITHSVRHLNVCCSQWNGFPHSQSSFNCVDATEIYFTRFL